MIQKLLVVLFGGSEYVLRAFPLVCGTASIFLFYRVAKDYIDAKAVALALGLFAISNRLIYYSSEVKQYSTDVAIALLLYAISIHVASRRLSISKAMLFGFIGAIAVWLSHPAAFVLTGICATLGLSALLRKDWTRVGRLAVACSIWVLSFGIVYFVSLRALSQNDVLLDFWDEHFMPFPPSCLSDFAWFIKAFLSFVKYVLGFALGDLIGIPVFEEGVFLPGLENLPRVHLAGVVFLVAIAFISALIAVSSFLIGCVSMLARKREKAFLLLSPGFFALLASGLRKYPFGSRFLLFMLPAALIMIAAGTSFVREKTKGKPAIITGILIVLLFSYPSILAGYHLVRPRTVEEIRPVLSYLEKHWRKGDALYIYYGSLRAFSYYSERYGLDEIDHTAGTESRDDLDGYLEELDKLQGGSRTWILFSHVCTWSGVDEEEFFISHLDRMGTRMRFFGAPGASVYLYNLSSTRIDG
jgi:hypothetical protein